MIDYTAWISRLSANVAALSGRAYDYARFLRDFPAWPDTPAAYLYPHNDAGGEIRAVNCPDQYNHPAIAILLVVAAADPPSFAALQSVRKAVWAALANWQPADCDDLVHFASGELVQAIEAIPSAGQPAMIVWRDVYRTHQLLQA